MNTANVTTKLATIGLILALALQAQASNSVSKMLLKGVDSSGGGNAVVCRDTSGTIKSAEVLDLFEARVLFGLSITSHTESAGIQAQDRVIQVQKLNTFGYLFLNQTLDTVMKNARVLPDGIGLQPIDDSFSPVIPRGCKIEQLAAYRIDDELYIDGEIWKALDETNRAALYVHETIYKKARDNGSTNSVRTRKIVGHIFADYPFKPEIDFPASRSTGQDVFCSADNSKAPAISAVMIHSHDGVTTAYFLELGGLVVVNQKKADFDKPIGYPRPTGVFFAAKSPTAEYEDGDTIFFRFEPSLHTGTLIFSKGLGINGNDQKLNVVCDAN